MVSGAVSDYVHRIEAEECKLQTLLLENFSLNIAAVLLVHLHLPNEPFQNAPLSHTNEFKMK